MTYIPISPNEREEMLKTIGVKSIDDLFIDIPKRYRFPKLDMPPALSEMEASQMLEELAMGNENIKTDLVSFLGAGAYNHYIPAAVDHILLRGEFYTAYTPYQPEISQGTLQAIFEYQSLIAALTGMEVSNASHYDGGTAVAESVGMAYAHFRGKRTKIVLSPSINPQYRSVLKTYTQDINVEFVGNNADSVENESLKSFVDENTALVIVQYPDFFGRIGDYSMLIDAAHQAGALVCMAVNPIALGVLKSPGEMGADIVVGEGQPLGIPLSYGGPYLGFFATCKEYIHKMAGRIVGETVDNRGQRAYVLTLTAREQHIKRERATSNICTNQGLMALASAVYLSLLGQKGLRQVAELCYQKAHYASNKLSQIPGYKLCFNSPFFNEFAISCPRPVKEINTHLLEHGFIGGFDLSHDYPNLKNSMLIAVTEMNSKEEIDTFAELLAEGNHD
jgi:glycine dehydrogenase subunit 1